MKNADKPAYPVECRFGESGPISGVRTGEHTGFMPGLTKREMMAIAAMQGICSNPTSIDIGYQRIAIESVLAADELLKALES